MNMKETLYYIIALFLILIIAGIRAAYNQKKRRREILKEKWGKMSDDKFDDNNYKRIRYYFDNHEKSDVVIDDITWNDLSMNDIYERMNNTSSSIGDEYLYNMLREVSTDIDELKKRDSIMEYFSDKENTDTRIDIQERLYEMGNYSNISIYKYLKKVSGLKNKSIIRHIIQDVLLIGSLFMILQGVNAAISISLFIFMMLFNVATYFREKTSIDSLLGLFSYILRVNVNIEKISKIIDNKNIKVLEKENSEIKAINKKLSSLKRGYFLLNNGGVAKSIEDVVFDYVKMFTHIDIMKFNRTQNKIKENINEIIRLYEIVGYIDSLLSVASFRNALSTYSKPELLSSKDVVYEAKNLYHPLLKEPVKNSIDEKSSVLITGSNASGKSTFIKTLAINALFSQTIYTSVSDYYKGSFFDIYSSMALKDDIFSSESYYMVEIKSLKRIIDANNKDIPVLCFVDEVLRGTNTLERIAASSQILVNLAKQNVMCFAATHDIELTYILKNYYNNYHFQEEVVDDDVVFDFKLYKGPATSRNAIKLLNMIGYSKEIVDSAKASADIFLKDGIWNVID